MIYLKLCIFNVIYTKIGTHFPWMDTRLENPREAPGFSAAWMGTHGNDKAISQPVPISTQQSQTVIKVLTKLPHMFLLVAYLGRVSKLGDSWEERRARLRLSQTHFPQFRFFRIHAAFSCWTVYAVVMYVPSNVPTWGIFQALYNKNCT